MHITIIFHKVKELFLLPLLCCMLGWLLGTLFFPSADPLWEGLFLLDRLEDIVIVPNIFILFISVAIAFTINWAFAVWLLRAFSPTVGYIWGFLLGIYIAYLFIPPYRFDELLLWLESHLPRHIALAGYALFPVGIPFIVAFFLTRRTEKKE